MKKVIWIFRVLIFYILLTPVTILFSLAGSLCIFLPFQWRYQVITSWSHYFIWSVKHICGLDYEVTGLDNIPKTACVVLCNHQSTWETIFMQVLLPPQSWILKRELLWIPFFGWGLALLDPIAINRQDRFSARATITKGVQKIDKGRWILLYPEGTRRSHGSIGPFSRTGAGLAKQANVPILPIAHDAGQYWPRGPWIKKPGTIKVKIGSLIDTTDKSTHDITEQAKQTIIELLQ